MALLIGLICGGVVLVVPLVALVKASGAAKEVDDLKQKVQRLEDRLNEMGDQFTDTKPEESEIKHAALAKPEPKNFTLPREVKESREARLAEKKKETPVLKQPLAPPPIIQSPKPVPHVEPAAKPSEPAKPEKVAATAQAGMPRLPKVDAQSIEMKLGAYWFVRIGVMLVLTGLGFLAYRTKGFGFIELSPGAKVSLFIC